MCSFVGGGGGLDVSINWNASADAQQLAAVDMDRDLGV